MALSGYLIMKQAKMKKSFGGASKVGKKIKPLPDIQNDSDDDEEAPP